MYLQKYIVLCCVFALAWSLPSSLFEDELFLGDNQPATDHPLLMDHTVNDSFINPNETHFNSNSSFSELSSNSTNDTSAAVITTSTDKTEVTTKSVIEFLMDLDVTDDQVVNRPTTKDDMAEGEAVKHFEGDVDALNKQFQNNQSFLQNQELVTELVTSPVTTVRVPLVERPAEVDNGETILSFHPRNDTSSSHFIRFSTSTSAGSNDWQSYVDRLESFLAPYNKEAQQNNVHCDFERVLQEGEACRFDLVYLGPSCTKRNNFGYSIGKPCVILSPAAIPHWVPAPYENDTTHGVPDEVQRLMRIFNANFMFVTCDGATEADRRAIGPMAYLPPYQGFPSYFFPSRGASNYLPPLMAIEFLNPANSTRIDVVCKAWANNLDQQPFKTTLRFSLQVN